MRPADIANRINDAIRNNDPADLDALRERIRDTMRGATDREAWLALIETVEQKLRSGF